jgi:Family of unknown function (DUF5724)/Domain of unknown function (DUF4132)
MLRREDADKILKEEQTSNWTALCLSAIQTELPEELRPVAYALLNRDENGKPITSVHSDPEVARRHWEAVERGFEALYALDPDRRTAVFAALVPRVASTVEAAWQLLGRLPYQAGWQRKAFRTPGDEAAAYTARVAWLRSIMMALTLYRDKDLPWFAAWVPYLGYYGQGVAFGILFAAAIDEGGVEGEAVFDVLVASARGEHPVGKMGQHVTTGLLVAGRPDGWMCIERLLLAAQRDEGLRQVILEMVDHAHPHAFRRLLRLILDHDLTRFHATVRAADVWFGFEWTMEDVRAVRHAISAVLSLLDDPAQRRDAIARGNPQETYFALWVTAFEDAVGTISVATPALADGLEELLDGAVDVAWFLRSYRELGAQRWEEIYSAAKYASNGTGPSRARLFADVMTGKISAQELHQRMAAKRQQDAVRALGLAPLFVDGEAREAEIAGRYKASQEFARTGRQFGAQRRASEETATRIGLENLARTAGYPDPIRLQWAMEARMATDLREGMLTVEEGDMRVTLVLDAGTAKPQLTFVKGDGKVLKTMPTQLKKKPEIAALIEREREVEQQIARIHVSLEAAMCRGDRFTAAELVELLAHRVLSRLLRNLVFVRVGDQRDEAGIVLGYPLRSDDGILLFCDYDGATTSVGPATSDLRLAHPYDLLTSGAWHAWQRECFMASRIQPFKQVFRELYVCTRSEMREGDEVLSRRYSGHQVQQHQALALLGQRGWVAHYEGEVCRTFHAEGLSAMLTFAQGVFTPAEVGGSTVEDVSFTRRGDWKPIPLASVPPRVFSEVMRDLDLIVSVAHSGGVDPEATASTVEMRAALVGETCALLGLKNVTIKSAHAVIEGTLGSAVVHRQPGGALCIVQVHAQQRGRLFLPFADDDPKTAEVVTKIVTLARDKDIKDPSILEQIL